MKVELIDHLGSDLTVVNAARVSFDKHKSELDGSDSRLIDYLARNNHWTPFGHPQVQLRLTTPICIAAQLKRHQVGAVLNEVSRRYVYDSPNYTLPIWRRRHKNAKQGSGKEFPSESITHVNNEAAEVMDESIRVYLKLINQGIAPEQARYVLPQGVDTSWYWTASLFFYARLCSLRIHPHAQKEARQVAEEIDSIVRSLFPISWHALRMHYSLPE